MNCPLHKTSPLRSLCFVPLPPSTPLGPPLFHTHCRLQLAESTLWLGLGCTLYVRCDWTGAHTNTAGSMALLFPFGLAGLVTLVRKSRASIKGAQTSKLTPLHRSKSQVLEFISIYIFIVQCQAFLALALFCIVQLLYMS